MDELRSGSGADHASNLNGRFSELMYGFISGMTDVENIVYCPKCGEEICTFFWDGTAVCEKCNFHFGVVECEGED